MRKIHQRLILIVAILVSALAYGLSTWKQDQQAEDIPKIDTVSRTMHFALPTEMTTSLLAAQQEFILLSALPPSEETLLYNHNTIMGGLGAQGATVQGITLELAETLQTDDWQLVPHNNHDRLWTLRIPQAQLQKQLSGLRICWNMQGYCHDTAMQQQGSQFLYLIDLRTVSMRYFGDFRWGILALVQDIQHVLGG